MFFIPYKKPKLRGKLTQTRLGADTTMNITKPTTFISDKLVVKSVFSFLLARFLLRRQLTDVTQ